MNKLQALLRKKTTPVHLIYGFASAFLCYELGFLFGSGMMIGFAIWERWNDTNEEMRKDAEGIPYVYEGDWDFWESTITFTIGMVVLAILKQFGIISLGWW